MRCGGGTQQHPPVPRDRPTACIDLTLVSFQDKPQGSWKNQVFAPADEIDDEIINKSPAEQREAYDMLEDNIFYMFSKDGKTIQIGKFLAALRETGLRKNDRRLQEMNDSLHKVFLERENLPDVHSPESQVLDLPTFRRLVTGNIHVISRAMRQRFVIPDFTNFCRDVEAIYWHCKTSPGGKDGEVASYIPQLARVEPNYWGVSVCTVDGQRYCIGDVAVPFTVQSISKPLTYGLVLDELGQELVHQYVGQEPSGRMFNELVLDHNKKPHNPMINAGAIIVCSLLQTLAHKDMNLAERFDHVKQYFSRLAGDEYVGFNNAVFLSEREAADRNYALGFYMRENKCFPAKSNLREVMDFYFQCCSMETTCDAMSVVAATLANGGICPTSEEKVMSTDSVRDVLSLMHSCGMYDYSGQFAFNVGLPAKSGVSGGMMLVVPNVMGICLWSPPLDMYGNSVRGIQFCSELVNMFNFHRYDNLKYSTDKKDPRRHKHETKGINIVNLLFSAASGDVSAMRRHKLSGMNMSERDYDGRTALHVAAAEGHLECVEFLLHHCAVSPAIRDRWGNTPREDAVRFQHERVAELIGRWASQHATDGEEREQPAGPGEPTAPAGPGDHDGPTDRPATPGRAAGE
ncbi:glutaminase liver isoform, mitochondrial-like isoform X1 [Pollicipes pollicipes]|uniref:glutaminase liver isoform, mitochondrial-like isoform X1 n=2 Tax=Pollicipes pollicipes TaxID=41117 RepID=UPI0018852E49|nr:glutaminase liver isoform, mitochondrial-like isoform X1 [Pollicipes pollicipes]